MRNDLRLQWELAGGSSLEHWDHVTIEDLLATPKSIAVGVMYPGEQTEGGVPLLKVAGVKNGRVISKPDYLISPKKDEEHKRTRLVGDELLITLVGNPGDCVYVTEDMAGWNVARAIAALRLKDPGLRSWIRYVLLSSPAQHFLDSRLNTTVQRTLNLKDIRELALPIPPEKERSWITNVLDALDDKIELNRQMSITLEAMAQALFKSWFVDFDPVIDNALAAGNPIPEPLQIRAEVRAALGDKRKPLPEAIQKQFPSSFVFSEEMEWIPEGWKVESIGDTLELAYGKSLSATKRVDGNVPVYGSGGVTGTHNEKLVNGPGLVVGRKGTVGTLYWVEEDFFPIDTVFYVVRKAAIPLYWLYQALQLIDIKSMGADSAVPGVNRNTVYARRIVLPCNDILTSYLTHIDANNSKQSNLSLQSQSLSKLRDTLLPKLLSGQLRIPDAEKLVAAAV